MQCRQRQFFQNQHRPQVTGSWVLLIVNRAQFLPRSALVRELMQMANVVRMFSQRHELRLRDRLSSTPLLNHARVELKVIILPMQTVHAL